MTKEEKRIEALKRLQYLSKNGMKYKEPITAFENGDIGIFENQGSVFKSVYYSLDLNQGQYPYNKIKEEVAKFEEEYNSVVYLIQLAHTQFGKVYNMFYVSDNEEEWEMDWDDLKQKYSVVYCYNISDPMGCEIGSIAFEYDNICGGIYRVG